MSISGITREDCSPPSLSPRSPGNHRIRNGAGMTNFFGTQLSVSEKNIRLAFRVSLFIKGVFALLEIAGGALAYFISQKLLVSFITAITQDELVEDPNDFVANYLLHLAQDFSISTQYFTAFYLLSHGVLKLFLIAGLLRERLWYYPLATIVFALFIVYQLYRFSFTHSVWLLVITILDMLVIWLTWREYKYLRRDRAVEGA
jgi:uncharacterized membrane protein